MSTQSIPQEIKRCPKCDIEYPRTLEYWHANKKRADGLQSWCKGCINENSNKWKRNNPERRRETDKKWVLNNPDKIRARWRRWIANNPERHRENIRKWRGNNPEKAAAIERRHRMNHPEQIRIKDQRRTARKHNLPATLTQVEWENILADYGYQCAYCEKTWLDCKLAQDHVIPVIQGGGYTADNIVPACKSCNSKKGARTPEQAGMTLRNHFPTGSKL